MHEHYLANFKLVPILYSSSYALYLELHIKAGDGAKGIRIQHEGMSVVLLWTGSVGIK